NHDGPDTLTSMHEVKTLVDLLQGENMGNHGIDLDLAVHIPIDDLGHVRAALGAAECRAAPVTARHELEGPRGDLLARLGHADDDAGAPAAMAGLKRRPHHFGIAGAIEGIVSAA